MERRVGFMGASGTGKTTLAAFVAKEFGLEVNPIGSRSVARDMGFDSPYGVDAAGKRAEFQRRLLSEKRGWEDSRASFVSDRTTIDNLAYTALHSVDAIDEETIRSAVEGYARYTHVFFCPFAVHNSIGNDPARVKSSAYHMVFEALLRGLRINFCEALGTKGPNRRAPPHYVLGSSDLSERKAYVREVLNAG